MTSRIHCEQTHDGGYKVKSQHYSTAVRSESQAGDAFEVLLEPAEEGGYAVHVPALRGCHTQGETVEECLENAKDAIESYLKVVHHLARRNRQVKRYDVRVMV